MHAGMNLRTDDFNALAEDPQISMDKEHVSFPAQNRLLAAGAHAARHRQNEPVANAPAVAGQAGLALLAALWRSALAYRARAAANTPKAAVNYQYTPKGDQHCGACASFIPGADPHGPGTCQIVEGPIPQNGWCALFSRR